MHKFDFNIQGITTMTLTAGLPELRPSSCNGHSNCQQPLAWQLAVLYTGLGLIALGAGGVRPCNIAFGADQFDTRTEKGKTQLESFCNWWYFLFTISLLVALTGVVYVQTNVSWVAGFIIPTACFAISIALFLFGHTTYILVKPQGSIFTDLLKVIPAAFVKRSIVIDQQSPSGHFSFYDPDDQLLERKLARTQRLCFFDKAAIITDPDKELDNVGKPKNGWRLCNVQQVEQLKCVIGAIPVWITGIGCFIGMQQLNSFGILQAIQADRSIGKKNFKVPPAWLGLIPMFSLSIWVLFYEKIHVPQMSKRSIKEKRLSLETRIRLGIVMSILCMVVAGLTEMVRRESALKNESFESPISFTMLMPEFALSGLIEAFGAIALMEFLTTIWPISLRTMAGAVFFLSASIASYMSSILIKIVIKISKMNGNPPWLGGNDLNNNRLDYYFYIITVLGVLNLLYFQFYARHSLSSSAVKGREINTSSSNNECSEDV